MKLTLVNHACCKIQSGKTGILCDPWTEGPAFNFGWDLLIPTPYSLDQVMEGVSHVWISHEHPDHFSIGFLTKMAKLYKDKVTILFQKTRDRRVYNFCVSQGLKVEELENRKPTRISDEMTVMCGFADFYDSWLSMSDGKTTILNLNDVHTRTDADAASIATAVPSPTVLLSQFSYASWKGGRDNPGYRALAASQKLETLARQIRHLRPEYTVPFASMVYFSNVENSYLNDHVNTPARANAAIEQTGCRSVVMYPGDTWDIANQKWDNKEALSQYEKQYAGVANLPYRDAGKSSTMAELEAAFAEYQKKVYSKNSRLLINLSKTLSPVRVFQLLTVELYDIGKVISFSVTGGLKELDASSPIDVKMHSSSFLFILKNEFGFDTICVNGRFEATAAGFARMTKSMAIGSLNAMGLSLSLSLLADAKVVVILLKILSGVLSKMKQSEAGSSSLPQAAKDKRVPETAGRR